MKILAYFIIFTITLNCSQKLKPSEPMQEPLTPITISKGDLFGGGEEGIAKQNLIIKDNTTWKDLLSKMNAVNPVTESFKETDIDFSKHIVIAVFENVKNTGGNSIDLVCSDASDKIVVTCKTKTPEGMAMMVITQPYHIIKITKTNKEIVFN